MKTKKYAMGGMTGTGEDALEALKNSPPPLPSQRMYNPMQGPSLAGAKQAVADQQRVLAERRGLPMRDTGVAGLGGIGQMYKKGGKVKGYASGGVTRADGCVTKGHTKGKMR